MGGVKQEAGKKETVYGCGTILGIGKENYLL